MPWCSISTGIGAAMHVKVTSKIWQLEPCHRVLHTPKALLGRKARSASRARSSSQSKVDLLDNTVSALAWTDQQIHHQVSCNMHTKSDCHTFDCPVYRLLRLCQPTAPWTRCTMQNPVQGRHHWQVKLWHKRYSAVVAFSTYAELRISAVTC